jgi:hypothetical protein
MPEAAMEVLLPSIELFRIGNVKDLEQPATSRMLSFDVDGIVSNYPDRF